MNGGYPYKQLWAPTIRNYCDAKSGGIKERGRGDNMTIFPHS